MMFSRSIARRGVPHSRLQNVFSFQSNPTREYSAAVMPHALKVSVYFMVWFVAVSLIAFRWFSEFNLPTVIGLGLLMAVAMILFGRWLFGRKNLV